MKPLRAAGWRKPIHFACALCGGERSVKVRHLPEGDPEADAWSETHGWLKIVVKWCPVCDPNLAEVLG